jgi:hypothetical protein
MIASNFLFNELTYIHVNTGPISYVSHKQCNIYFLKKILKDRTLMMQYRANYNLFLNLSKFIPMLIPFQKGKMNHRTCR